MTKRLSVNDKIDIFLRMEEDEKFKEDSKLLFDDNTLVRSFFKNILGNKNHPRYKEIRDAYDDYLARNNIFREEETNKKIEAFFELEGSEKFSSTSGEKLPSGGLAYTVFKKVINNPSSPYYGRMAKEYNDYLFKKESKKKEIITKLLEFSEEKDLRKFHPLGEIYFKKSSNDEEPELMYNFWNRVNLNKIEDTELVEKVNKQYQQYLDLNKKNMIIPKKELELFLEIKESNKFYFLEKKYPTSDKTFLVSNWFIKYYNYLISSEEEICKLIINQFEERLLIDFEVFLGLSNDKFNYLKKEKIMEGVNAFWWYKKFLKDIKKIAPKESLRRFEEQLKEYDSSLEREKKHKERIDRIAKLHDFSLKLIAFKKVGYDTRKFDRNDRTLYFENSSRVMGKWFYENYSKIALRAPEIIKEYERYLDELEKQKKEFDAKLDSFCEQSSYLKYTPESNFFFSDGKNFYNWLRDNLSYICQQKSERCKKIMEEYEFIQKLLEFNAISDFKKFMPYKIGDFNEESKPNRWFYDNKNKIFTRTGKDFDKIKKDYALFLEVYNFVDDQKIVKTKKLG